MHMCYMCLRTLYYSVPILFEGCLFTVQLTWKVKATRVFPTGDTWGIHTDWLDISHVWLLWSPRATRNMQRVWKINTHIANWNLCRLTLKCCYPNHWSERWFSSVCQHDHRLCRLLDLSVPVIFDWFEACCPVHSNLHRLLEVFCQILALSTIVHSEKLTTPKS